jgi:hypothetical protein
MVVKKKVEDRPKYSSLCLIRVPDEQNEEYERDIGELFLDMKMSFRSQQKIFLNSTEDKYADPNLGIPQWKTTRFYCILCTLAE